MVFSGNKENNYSIIFSPDSKTIVLSFDNSNLTIFDVIYGQKKAVIKDIDIDHKATIFSPDSLTLASFSESNNVKLWDVSTGRTKGMFKGLEEDISNLKFSPDGRYLAAGFLSGNVWLWDVVTKRGKPIPMERTPHNGMINALTFSPNSRILAIGNENGAVTLWDLTMDKSVADFMILLEIGSRSEGSRIYSFAFSPDDCCLSIDALGGLYLYDITRGAKRIVQFGFKDDESNDNGAEDIIYDFGFSPEGCPLAVVATPPAFQLTDYSPLLDNRPIDVRIAEASHLYGLALEGIELKLKPWKNELPIWPLDHQLYLEPLAQQGNRTAMVELGIAYELVWQHEKALPWYEKAAALEDDYGAQRLSWLKSRLARPSVSP